MMLCLNRNGCDIMLDIMNKKSGRRRFKSAAMLAVLCVVLGGCSGSSDQTDATVLPVETTASAAITYASAGSTVASSGEAEVVVSARTSPSSVPNVPSTDDSKEADVQDSTPSVAVIPSTTTTVLSSTIDDVSTKTREEALAEIIARASSRNASEEEIAELIAWALSEIASEEETAIQQPVESDETPTEGTEEETDIEEEEASIQQPAESEETTTEETAEEAETLKECQTTEIDAAKTAENTDFIKGRITLSDEGKPLRLQSLRVDTYPGLWVPVEPDNDLEILNLELRDDLGVTVYCVPFSIHPEFSSNFLVRIPDPPDYDRIAIVNSDIDIGEIRRSRITPIVEDLTPERGSLYCYEEVIRGRTNIRARGTFSRLSIVNSIYSIWISTDGGTNYENILRPSSASEYLGDYFSKWIHPAELHRAEDVYIRVHVSNSTRTSYAETYVKFDPSACSSEQKQVEAEIETSPERQDQEISAGTECDLPRLNPEGEQNEKKLDHIIDAEVYLSFENDPIGLSSFQVEVLAVPSLSSEPSAGGTHLRGTIELRDATGQAVFSSQYIVFWPPGTIIPYSKMIPGDVYFEPYFSKYRSSIFVSGAFPDPADYESIAVLYAGEEIGVFHKSSNSPVVEIVSPGCGEVYRSDDTIRMTWYGYDLDGDDLEYEVWYSIDDGASYRRAYLEDDYTFKDFVFQREDFSGRVYVRVHVTDGFLTDHAETYFEISEGETPEAEQE